MKILKNEIYILSTFISSHKNKSKNALSIMSYFAAMSTTVGIDFIVIAIRSRVDNTF